MQTRKTILSSAIVLYFIIGLEILIMISPFAGFFYSVFNPVLLGLASTPATRWLSAFFLPHMIIPASGFLMVIRVMGSILFIAGMLIFLVCAFQIYANKFFRKGAVVKGIYSYIRHPQYLGLGIAGIGLSVLWPRFLVLALWLAMIDVYYVLAKDEERRMLRAHEADYGHYMERTGMFLPAALERPFSARGAYGKLAIFIIIAMITLGGGFLLRFYTIKRLPLWIGPNITAISVIPEDVSKMDHRMEDILKLKDIGSRLDPNARYLVYFLPEHYIMQGLIADTGGDWKLYKRHHTFGMISDWILHPVRHLNEGHHSMHSRGDYQRHLGSYGIKRRLIFLKVGDAGTDNPQDVFSINSARVPQFVADIEVHTLELFEVKDLPQQTGWGTVPTPIF